MPTTWNQVPISDLEFVVETLVSSASLLKQSIDQLKHADIDHAWVPWTDATLKKVTAIQSLARQTFADVPDQIAAKKFNRPSRTETEKARAAKDSAKRASRNAETEGPPKKRGRPKKNP